MEGPMRSEAEPPRGAAQRCRPPAQPRPGVALGRGAGGALEVLGAPRGFSAGKIKSSPRDRRPLGVLTESPHRS